MEQTEELIAEDTALMPRSSPDGSAVTDIDNEQYGSLLHALFFLEIVYMNWGLWSGSGLYVTANSLKQPFSSNTTVQNISARSITSL